MTKQGKWDLSETQKNIVLLCQAILYALFRLLVFFFNWFHFIAQENIFGICGLCFVIMHMI
jgi:hypothetical protein